METFSDKEAKGKELSGAAWPDEPSWPSLAGLGWPNAVFRMPGHLQTFITVFNSEAAGCIPQVAYLVRLSGKNF